jgi:hypothetical protein
MTVVPDAEESADFVAFFINSLTRHVDLDPVARARMDGFSEGARAGLLAGPLETPQIADARRIVEAFERRASELPKSDPHRAPLRGYIAGARMVLQAIESSRKGPQE